MKFREDVEILVVGAGMAGIATAYYLCTTYKKASVLLVDRGQPMSFTSAQSGDNYRNWWPHPTMTRFTNDSIDLMQQIAAETSNILMMTRRGYILATRREEIDDIVADLGVGYRCAGADDIRIHAAASTTSYVTPEFDTWESAPRGVDVLSNRRLIQQSFPSLNKEVAHLVHIRRAGDISGQQLGQYMLERIRQSGGKRITAAVRGIAVDRRFTVDIEGSGGIEKIAADVVVNAAGPFAREIAAMMGVSLPIENVYQQKLAFDDSKAVIPRQLPFSVDLDGFQFDWSDEERTLLAEDAETAWLTERLQGGAHCRPEGGDKGSWVKLGWAFNSEPGEPQEDLANEPRMHPQYPEFVMRAATQLHPSLAAYADDFPSRFTHYGGYYSMTPENWPLIGPLAVDGAFVSGALSGFGSMSACAAGAICAAWIAGGELPDYASQLTPARYADNELMAELRSARSTGIL